MKNLQKLLVAVSVMLGATAFAQQGHLNVKTEVQKEEIVVNENGDTERRLVAAATVVPGDDVIYTITFTNISDEVAENVVITNPISDNLTYVEGSAFGPGTNIEFSVDGGTIYGELSALTVEVDGESRPARAEDITHVRWTMQDELQAGAKGMAQFRARLN